jgi:hypothetical protein
MRLLGLGGLVVAVMLAAAASASAATNGQIVGRGYPNQLFTINPDGTGLEQRYLGAAGETVAHPAWSPDGNRFAFEDLDSAHGGRIFVYDLATRTARPVTDHPATDSHGALIQDFHPSWSADGARILFVRVGSSTYLSIRADGTDLQPLAVPFEKAGTWSPDGTRVAYRALDADVGVVDADGGNAHTLVPIVNGGAPYGDDIPQWSPDSTQIVFTRNDLGSSHLMRVPAAGGTPVDVSPRPVISAFGYPDWSPDGTQIVYNCIQCGGARIVAIDGSGDHALGSSVTMHPDWQPCVAGVTVSCTSVTPVVTGARPTCPAQVAVSTPRDTPLDLPPAPCNDPRGRPLSLILVDGPQHGTLSGPRADGHRTFTPARGYVGDDVIHYRATNGAETSDLATVLVHVLPGGSGGGGGSGAADTRAPTLRWLASPRLGRDHTVRVRLRCDEACTVSAHLASRLRGGRTRSGPTVGRSASAGHVLKFTLKLGRRPPSRRALRSLKIVVTVADAAHNKARTTRAVRLR